MTDYTQYITSQHINKPKFVAMVSLVGGALDAGVQSFYAIQNGFDIDNAIGPQLDIVGLWVGQPRVVQDILEVGFFGFADDDAALPFGELINVAVGGRFYEQGEIFSSSTTLGDPEYRTILRAKIVRNQYDGTLPGLEAALQYVFGVPCAVIDPGNKTLAINIGRPITAVEKTLISTFDLLPRGAGLRIATVQYYNFIAAAAKSASAATGHL